MSESDARLERERNDNAARGSDPAHDGDTEHGGQARHDNVAVEPATAQSETSRPPRFRAPGDDHSAPRREQRTEATLLEQMGGISGMAFSAVPILVFITVNALAHSLTAAIWSAVSVAVVLAIVRLIRKEPLQPAISGVLGVAVCAFIAYRTGEAKGFFLWGIWTSLVYGGILLVSVIVRWPLVGVAWSTLNGTGFAWRRVRKAVIAYDIATLAWVIVFAARYVVQQWLYDTDATGWLAFARIAMGFPLAALAFLVTIWAIRRVRHLTSDSHA